MFIIVANSWKGKQKNTQTTNYKFAQAVARNIVNIGSFAIFCFTPENKKVIAAR